MSNPFKQFFTQVNSYSRSDRNAIIILSGLILLVIVSNVIYNAVESKALPDFSEREKIIQELQSAFTEKEEVRKYLFVFDPNIISEISLDSLALPKFVKQNMLSFRKAGGKFYEASDLKKIYGMNDSIFNLAKSFVVINKEKSTELPREKETKEPIYYGTFDPNEAEPNEFKKFGFNTFQLQNLLSYRKKGGEFTTPSDLLKIYGVDSVFFLSIEKHIKLVEPKITVENESKKINLNIELNGADSLQLVKLKGIGPVYASRIIKYRNLLGGFYQKNQLLEVYNFPEETFQQLKNSIFVDSTLIIPIRINFAEYNDLLKHPYLNKKQVNALLKYREKNGAFDKISDIELVKEVDPLTLNKIAFYFTCR